MIVLGYTGFTRDSRLPGGGRSPLAKTNQGFDNLFRFREGEVPFSMFPLGYLGHDASAALVIDGEVVACASEERFTRAKHALNLAGNTLLPRNAIRYCLKKASIKMEQVDVVTHYCDFQQKDVVGRLNLLRPFLSKDEVERVEASYQQLYELMLCQESVLNQFEKITGVRPKSFMPIRHHEAHAASAFFVSGFDQSLILTLDGTGELESSLLAEGRDSKIAEIRRTFLPTSLGALYLLVTVFLGFRSLDDEYKVMGLAAYGDPRRYREFFESSVLLEKGGAYSTPCIVRNGFKERLIEGLGPPRLSGEPIEERHADIAAALQEATERAVLHTLKHAQAVTGMKHLCMAGGVALNCSLNGVIARSGLFEEIFIQPAASDEGCSVGSALHAYHCKEEGATKNVKLSHAYLGPSYSSEEILETLEKYRSELCWERRDDIALAVAREVSEGKVVGWFQGCMEFGPRALGNRSILADPRDPGMKDRVNAKVKRRESFRPFAPAVLEGEAMSYFDMQGLRTSPFMLFAVPVHGAQRERIPAVTHVNGTARLQTVSQETNPLFWEVILRFGELTGVPIVLNTSFNVRDEPIVCSPEDTIRCFLSTEIDTLGIDHFLVRKRYRIKEQP
jgi:carbamoyltransferase